MSNNWTYHSTTEVAEDGSIQIPDDLVPEGTYGYSIETTPEGALLLTPFAAVPLKEYNQLKQENAHLNAVISCLQGFYENGVLVTENRGGVDEPFGVVLPYYIHDLFVGGPGALQLLDTLGETKAESNLPESIPLVRKPQ
jgi:hypothetical protein